MANYPFSPKSTRLLTPGDFWAVPFGEGSFASGRVLQTTGDQLVLPTRAFFGGVHDWVGDRPPRASDLEGKALLKCGVMHIKAIIGTGGMLLGNRPLDLDRLESPLLLSAMGGPGTTILRGAQTLRPAKRSEWGTLPVLGYWGADFIRAIAEARLRGHRRGTS